MGLWQSLLGEAMPFSDRFWQCSKRALLFSSGNFSCGGLLQGLSGTIQSPGYPNPYPDNSYCVWHIRLRNPSRRIQLQFTDVE